jgi:hypothetical protein
MKQVILLFTFFVGLAYANAKDVFVTDGGNNPKVNIKKTKGKAKEALSFCKANNFNAEFCILIDMSLHSGLNRFFVYDLQKDSIVNSFLVGHGCCDNPWSMDSSKDAPVFSNKDGSHCSALGKYKLGARGYSDWGIKVKYFMHGLEPTNNNALVRTIVFHSWDMVSDKEVYPDGTPEGWGCPTISNNSMKIIDPKLKASDKPVLMWIYK